MDMAFASCNQSLFLRIPKIHAEPISGSSPENTIVRFDFIYESRYFDWFLPSDSPHQRFVDRNDRILFKEIIQLTPEQVLSSEANVLLDERLGDDYPVYDSCRRFVVDYGLAKVREKVTAESIESGFRVSVPLHVIAMHRHVYVPCGNYMVPTDEKAIAALPIKEIKTAEDAGRTCVICIDGFGDEREVREMPCSHFFHGDCIHKWLRESHYCPCCRFEMAVQ